jgi:hypothetical protein
MSLKTQFKSLLEPELMERFLDTTLQLKIHRYPVGQDVPQIENYELGPLPNWYSLYEVKLELWNKKARDPSFAPPLVFIGKPVEDGTSTMYSPIEMLWMNSVTGSSRDRSSIQLVSPFNLMKGLPDSRFVDSAGAQKAIAKDNHIRMTLNDIFQLEEGKTIPELHVFLYSDLVDRIPGPRPLGERDVYGRVMPYFPFLNPQALPPASGIGAITPVLTNQADQMAASLKQISYLEELIQTLGGDFQLPKLDGIRFLRWVWNKKPADWEGAAILFFGIKVTHERPYMRLFPASGQPLTKVKVKGIIPIPDISEPNLLLGWKRDKNPDVGKDCTFIKMRLQIQDDPGMMALYSTMRIFSDGTADLLVLPPKQKRLLDPYSDLQDAPDALAASMTDMPYLGQTPSLGQADVVVKIRLKREDSQITKSLLQKRLKAFSSIFQEIPPLPDEQPLAMLRYKGVSNFSSEDRIFAFLTQIASHEMVEGEIQEDLWAPRVADEFQISIDEARKQVIAWTVQKNEYILAVPETKDYILNKNPGIDIGIFAQHPTYNFHIYRAQSFQVYSTIVNLLGLLISAPADRFTERAPPVKLASIARPELAAPAPVPASLSPAADPLEKDEPGNAMASEFPEDDDLPEFMRGLQAENDTDAIPDNDDMPALRRDPDTGDEDIDGLTSDIARVSIAAAPPPVAAAPPAPPSARPVAAAPAAAAPIAAITEEDKKAAKAFEKPKDIKAIKVKKYYIERLKAADPELFDYTHPTDRGYVSYCAANESRQPIVLDADEYREMREIYDDDDDLDIVVYPEDPKPAKISRKQPNKDENASGKLEGKDYPNEENKEVVSLVKYGSKTKRIHYYFCPRLFCIRDRLMVRYKDFKGLVDRKGAAKPANSCPFCKGTLVNEKLEKETDRDPNSTVLQRKMRPGSDSERQIYVGFLGNKKNPSGLSLPCCFADPSDRFDPNDPEFVRLGLRPTTGVSANVAAQPLADAIMESLVPGEAGQAASELPSQVPLAQAQLPHAQLPQAPLAQTQAPAYKYEPTYNRVIQGASVKSILDANRIPLDIIIPKATAPDDPKAGPQIGLLPEALDKFFAQDSLSDKFAERMEIVRKLKPTAKGFLRLAVDNTEANKAQAVYSAIAPFLSFQPNADGVADRLQTISPKQFLQLNSGNLVHEFFNKCDKKNQNDMRSWVAKYVAVDELKSSNIPAIERLMNSYECFQAYIDDPKQRKDLRVIYQAISEPNIIMRRGILLIVLEVSVEDSTIKRGEKTEFKREVKFERVRCPQYPLSEGQQAADIGFIVHYSTVTRDRYNPQNKTYKSLAWEPLFYVDGTGLKDGRHRPTLFFQRSEEASWPPIVQKRVSEFFYNCGGMNRGPFTSQTGINPNALISAEELIKAVQIQANGIIRDSYNHLVGMAYREQGKSEIVAVPIADDGSIHFERRIFFDWDDFQPASADRIIRFYKTNIISTFPQYSGYKPRLLQRSRDTGKIIGVVLQNGISIPATEPKEPASVADMRIVDVDDLEWDINRTIAYDTESRKRAFKLADEEDDEGKRYMQLKMSSIQDDIEDIYQHLRVSFSNWLAIGAGRDIRLALEQVLKKINLPLYEKRKRLDILLEDKVMRWMEPRDTEEDPDIGFLRIDCLVQDEADCTGRCKWLSADKGVPGSAGVCKIHTPAKISQNGVVLNVPRMLYLRLVDELIRYASKREEIFLREVPRLTIRQEAQRKGDQYIIPEGSPDWNTWWEYLRTEWMTPEKESAKFFDEQYNPAPEGLPGDTSVEKETRTLPETIVQTLDSTDPKTSNLVWNPSTNQEVPYIFLRSILGKNNDITTETESLTREQIDEIAQKAAVRVVYLPNGSLVDAIGNKKYGQTEAIIIANVNGVIGWLSQIGTYGVKIPISAIPNVLIR